MVMDNKTFNMWMFTLMAVSVMVAKGMAAYVYYLGTHLTMLLLRLY